MDLPSRMDEIKTPKVERALLRQFHHSREYVTGTLCLTDRHLIFIEPTGTKETWVLYHHIHSVERLPLTTKGYPVIIETKTFQQMHLIIPRESDCLDIIDTMKLFSQPESYRQLYAFQYKPKQSEAVKQTSGWALFDSQSEYTRMGVPNNLWKHTNINKSYNLCETYSSHLYVPAGAETNTIIGSAKFRSKGRLPVLSYYYAPKNAALCRCSQPLVGLRGRSVEDELMVQNILEANPNSKYMYVIDTRPKVQCACKLASFLGLSSQACSQLQAIKDWEGISTTRKRGKPRNEINAMANKAAGKGYESTENYSNVKYQFYNIHNIHVMRESLQRLIEAASTNNQSVSGFLSGLENSGWMKHIHLILEASMFTARALYKDGVSVLVHCSDGWDRTAQTCALVSIAIDSYYRSLHGFMVLIEKEWLSFGHKFSVRNGHLAGDVRDTSPIFTQFLECVWQMMVQFPTAFQFNEQLLLTLHDHLHSCQFGTFLGNCERERLEHRFSEQTYSFWGHVWAHLDNFINPLYNPATFDLFLELNTDIRHLSFWQGMYCRYNSRDQPSELVDEVLGSIKQQNDCLTEHIKFLQQNIAELRKTLTHFQNNSLPRQGTGRPLNSKPENQTPPENERPSRHLSQDESASSRNGSANALTSGIANHGAVEEVTSDSGIEQSCSETQSDIENPHFNRQPVPSDGITLMEAMRENEHFRALIDRAHGITEHSSTASNQGDVLKLNSPESQNEGVPEARTNGRDEVLASSRMSPESFTTFKDHLDHIPEMNLPWQAMRSVPRCSCGTAFTFSTRKFHCSYCGVVVCGSCGSSQAPLPWHATVKPQRVCKTCFKLMRRRMQDLELLMST